MNKRYNNYKPNKFSTTSLREQIGFEKAERLEKELMKIFLEENKQKGWVKLEDQPFSTIKTDPYKSYDYHLKHISKKFIYVECKVQNKFNTGDQIRLNSLPGFSDGEDFLELYNENPNLMDQDVYEITRNNKRYRITEHHNRPFFYIKQQKITGMIKDATAFNYEINRKTDGFHMLLFFFVIPTNEIWIYKVDEDFDRNYDKVNIMLMDTNQGISELKPTKCYKLPYNNPFKVIKLEKSMKAVQSIIYAN